MIPRLKRYAKKLTLLVHFDYAKDTISKAYFPWIIFPGVEFLSPKLKF